MIAEPSMQRAGSGNMREQVLHLVGENLAAFEVNIFGVSRRERNCDQLHCSLFGCSPALVVVAAATGCRNVVPDISAAVRQWRDVISCEIPGRVAHRTVETQIRITLEQRAVIQGRHILVTDECQAFARTISRDDGINVDGASAAT